MNILKIGIMALAVTACTNVTKETEATIGRNEIKLESDRMTPEALWAMGRIGSTAVSSDGHQIAYTVSYYSVEQNRSRTRIYVMDAGGSNPKEVSHNPNENVSESEPTFIKNNTELAFLSGGQLWSIRLSDGKAQQLTRGDDVEGYLFSPDEKHVILIHQVPATTSIAAQEPDLPKATGLVINDMNYKHWWRPREPTCLRTNPSSAPCCPSGAPSNSAGAPTANMWPTPAERRRAWTMPSAPTPTYTYII